MAHTEYFPSILSRRDLKTGDEISYFVNTGYILDVEIASLEKNSNKQQLIFGGINNAYQTAFLGVLNLNFQDGVSPATDEYSLTDYQVSDDLRYILIPPTIIGKKNESSDVQSD